jgi:hypothetical protein
LLTRLLWPRAALLLLIACLTSVAVICAQPYDDADLLAFLTGDEGCSVGEAAPCWAGIRPGVTTLDEARALLQAHPWVGAITENDEPLAQYLYWEWNGRQPAYLTPADDKIPTFMWAQDDIIQFITIPTQITFGDLVLVYGEPEQGVLNVSRLGRQVLMSVRPNARLIAAYQSGHLLLDITLRCPAPPIDVWRAPVILGLYSSPSLLGVALHPYDRAGWIYGSACVGA